MAAASASDVRLSELPGASDVLSYDPGTEPDSSYTAQTRQREDSVLALLLGAVPRTTGAFPEHGAWLELQMDCDEVNYPRTGGSGAACIADDTLDAAVLSVEGGKAVAIDDVTLYEERARGRVSLRALLPPVAHQSFGLGDDEFVAVDDTRVLCSTPHDRATEEFAVRPRNNNHMGTAYLVLAGSVRVADAEPCDVQQDDQPVLVLVPTCEKRSISGVVARFELLRCVSPWASVAASLASDRHALLPRYLRCVYGGTSVLLGATKLYRRADGDKLAGRDARLVRALRAAGCDVSLRVGRTCLGTRERDTSSGEMRVSLFEHIELKQQLDSDGSDAEFILPLVEKEHAVAGSILTEVASASGCDFERDFCQGRSGRHCGVFICARVPSAGPLASLSPDRWGFAYGMDRDTYMAMSPRLRALCGLHTFVQELTRSALHPGAGLSPLL